MSANAIHCYGIVTNDYEKAKEIILTIIQSRDDTDFCCMSKDNLMVRFKNGEKWVHVKPNSNARCIRLHRVLIDRNISVECLNNMIAPMCYGYCEYIEWI